MNLNQVLQDTDFEQARQRLAELINLDAAAPAAVTRRALLDKRFATYLMLTRDSPQLQQVLLNDPRTREYDQDADTAPAESSTDAPQQLRTNSELLAQASRSMLHWGKAGFKRIDDTQRARRWAVCQSCSQLTDPPETMLYQGLRLLTGGDTKICAACGCAANKKVGIPTENCPLPHPEDSSISKWGEPLRSSS